MEGKDLEELIDDYLLGRIQEEGLARLDYLRKSNPEIDQRVRQSIEVVEVLRYARYKQLRRLLQQIDETDSNSKGGSLFSPWIIISFVFIVSLIGVRMWIMEYWSPSSMALRHFTRDPVALAWNDSSRKTDEANWEKASRSFKGGDFQTAISLFQPYLENPDNKVASYARWNILLARFGLADPDIDWKEEIIQFESVAPEPFKAKATNLFRILDSPFYRIITHRLSPKLSVLKPRII